MFFQYAYPATAGTTFVTPVKFTHTLYNTRYASKDNFYKACFWTNTGKTMFSAQVVDHRKKLPQDTKDLRLSTFPRKVKQYLLSKQI